jgi:hypothetical protein
MSMRLGSGRGITCATHRDLALVSIKELLQASKAITRADVGFRALPPPLPHAQAPEPSPADSQSGGQTSSLAYLDLAGPRKKARQDGGLRRWCAASGGTRPWTRRCGGQSPRRSCPYSQHDTTGRRGRDHLASHGKCVLQRGVWTGYDAITGLRAHLEIWDEADGMRLLSVEGVPTLTPAGEVVCFGITGSDRTEVAGPLFSVAGRDPRLDTVQQVFTRNHEADSRSCISVRALMTDERTGRRALLWALSGAARFVTAAPSDYWQNFLPDGSIAVMSARSPLVLARAGPSEDAHAYVRFFLMPAPGQDGVPDREKKYRVAPGDDTTSFAAILFCMNSHGKVASLLRSLLAA